MVILSNIYLFLSLKCQMHDLKTQIYSIHPFTTICISHFFSFIFVGTYFIANAADQNYKEKSATCYYSTGLQCKLLSLTEVPSAPRLTPPPLLPQAPNSICHAYAIFYSLGIFKKKYTKVSAKNLTRIVTSFFFALSFAFAQSRHFGGRNCSHLQAVLIQTTMLLCPPSTPPPRSQIFPF